MIEKYADILAFKMKKKYLIPSAACIGDNFLIHALPIEIR
jgi:hypothetical protein